jgi:hypothetical protein
LQNSVGSRGGCICCRGFLRPFSVSFHQHLHHLCTQRQTTVNTVRLPKKDVDFTHGKT